MNIKIQGGGSGRYANKGSCTGIVSYLQHEDFERAIDGKPIEPFFNNDYDKISSKEVTYMIDHNKAQLHKTDSKFFVMTISPSQVELAEMGQTLQERALALKEYIRNDIMKQYAENFNRDLKKEDIMYYAKIHHDRGGKAGDNMHVHVIVSRKDISNTKKISPQTNHKNTKIGVVKGGFNRELFVLNCEKSFDTRFNYDRKITESFEYCNAMKNGNIGSLKDQVIKSVEFKMNQTKEKNINQNKTKQQEGIEL